METRSKRKAAEKNGTDRISQLPDECLIHILSFLSIIEAVKTCLVAKRWSKLWTQVPFLDLDSDGFNSEDAFTDCVTSVLKHRGATRLDTFHLAREYESEFELDPLFGWISQVVQLSPRSIYINVRVSIEELTLPESLFTCESLEELEIMIDIFTIVDVNTKAVKLPRLKKLYLSYVDINSNDISNLLGGCPLLEELYFKCCKLNFSQVSSNTLKSLVVGDCELEQEIQFPFLGLYNSF